MANMNNIATSANILNKIENLRKNSLANTAASKILYVSIRVLAIKFLLFDVKIGFIDI